MEHQDNLNSALLVIIKLNKLLTSQEAISSNEYVKLFSDMQYLYTLGFETQSLSRSLTHSVMLKSISIT